MPVKFIKREDTPRRKASVFSTKEWPLIERSVVDGIPDGEVLAIKFDGKNNQYYMNAIRKLCIQKGRKYIVFARQGTIYLSPM